MFTPPLEIHVQGISQVQRPAERGNLVIAVIAEGTSQTTVAAQVTKTSNNLQALFKQLSTKPTQSSSPPNSTIDEPPVTQYSTTNLRTRSWQIPDPNNEGEKISLHEASSHFEVTFRDFEKFAEVSSDLFVTPNTEIRSTTWSLTEEMQKEVGIQGREMAMRDAISKAEDYARVLGRKVMATEVRGDGTTRRFGLGLLVWTDVEG